MPMVNPPDTPPRDPRDLSDGIPEGLATKLGKLLAAALAVLAALAEFGVELDPDTQAMLNRLLAVVVIVMGGRYAQSYAALRDSPGAPAFVAEPLPDDDTIAEYGGERG